MSHLDPMQMVRIAREIAERRAPAGYEIHWDETGAPDTLIVHDSLGCVEHCRIPETPDEWSAWLSDWFNSLDEELRDERDS